MYEALHLTAMRCAYDGSEGEEGVIRGSYATNETHVADRQLIRMMLALPDLVLQRGDIYIYIWGCISPNYTDPFAST